MWVCTATAASGVKVAVDTQSNAYVAGGFRQAVDFGITNLSRATDHDSFVAKYNSQGAFQWVTRISVADGWASPTRIATDSADNCFITGLFRGTANFGDTNVTSSQDPALLGCFVAKYNASGSLRW